MFEHIPDVITMEELDEACQEIAVGLRVFNTPDSKYFVEYGDEAASIAEDFVSGDTWCCAKHRLKSIARLQMDLMNAVRACEKTDCSETFTHEFVWAVIAVIDVTMVRCITKVSLKEYLKERTN